MNQPVTKISSNWNSNFGGKIGTSLGLTSGGILGSVAGYTFATSSLGATIGTMFLPGIGSTIGGFVGAVAGFTIIGVSGALIGSEIGKNIEKKQNEKKLEEDLHNNMMVQDENLNIDFKNLESPEPSSKKNVDEKEIINLQLKKEEKIVKELNLSQVVTEEKNTTPLESPKTEVIVKVENFDSPKVKTLDKEPRTPFDSPKFSPMSSPKTLVETEPKTPGRKLSFYNEPLSVKEKKTIFEKPQDSPRLLKKTLSFSSRPKKEDFDFAATFDEIPNLPVELLKEIKSRNYSKPTAVQSRTLSLILNTAKNLIIHSEQGQGRKLCFGIAMLHHIDSKINNLQGIYICHNQDRVQQIYEYMIGFTSSKNLKICKFTEKDDSKSTLNHHIIIGTPEPISSLVLGKSISFKDVSILIIDKLENLVLESNGNNRVRSIRNKIEYIKKHLPNTTRYLMFSNTFQNIYDENDEETKKDRKLQEYIDKFVPLPKERIMIPKFDLIFSLIHQFVLELKDEKDFLKNLLKILEKYSDEKIIIYVSSIENLNFLKESLSQANFDPLCIEKKKDLIENDLIISLVPLKGIENVSLIINYDFPKDLDDYYEKITGFVGINQRMVVNFSLKDFNFIEKSVKKVMKHCNSENLLEIIEKNKN